jgi:DNA-binding CsgD family transcriptional regulator
MSPLIGRRDECVRIDDMLQQARQGSSSALVMRGEPGIGKSALLNYAMARAGELKVLSATGVESESKVAFAGLVDLLSPLLSHIERLPKSQAAALSGALAIGPPFPCDALTTSAATLALLGVAAEEQPVLAAIDDAHWLDSTSLGALLFSARRLHSEGVVMLFAVRSEGRESPRFAGIPEIDLQGLDWRAAQELLTERLGTSVTPEVASRLANATGGNPLALVECTPLLTQAQLSGTEPLDDPLPTGARLESAFLRRASRLPHTTREALLILAASESTDVRLIGKALKAAQIPYSCLSPAESSGIISVEGSRVQFGHPLLRSAVYHGVNPAERRRAHAALAEAFAREGLTDRGAWQLAAATVFPDEKVASTLEDAALSARGRGGHEAAASAYERSSALSESSAEAVRRQLEAARDWHLHGRSRRALELLDQASSATTDPLTLADINHMRGRVQIWTGAVPEARTLLLAEAARLETLDAERAAMLTVEAVGACFMTGDMRFALQTARLAHKRAGRVGQMAEHSASLMLAIALVASGHNDEAMPLIDRAEAFLEEADPLALGPAPFFGIAECFTWMEEIERARHLLDRGIGIAREKGAAGSLPFGLAVLSEVDERTGHWPAAYSNATQGLRLAQDADQQNQSGHNLVCLAHIEAAMGLEEDCRRHLTEASEQERRFGSSTLRLYVGSALGFLELGLGHPDKTVQALEPVREWARCNGLAEPSITPWQPDLIEAYVHVGRRSDAQVLLETFERHADRTGRPWTRAVSSRCRALLAPDSAYEHEFKEALVRHQHVPSSFERARTELCFGERLRSSGKKQAARRMLVRALHTFQNLGASGWAERASREIRATGHVPSRRTTRRSHDLTPQELQVALTVAQGMTNKEAAVALFVSPKTIESHLGHIYAKLGVRSRTELVNVMLQDGALG